MGTKKVWEHGASWLGGFVRIDKKGRTTFWIQRRVRGRKYKFSTRCTSEPAALKQLGFFEADPASYGKQKEAAPLRLDAALIKEYFEYCTRAKTLGGRGNTEKHAREKKALLEDWLVDFDGEDLRKISLATHVLDKLDARANINRQHRIIALKHFYTWLRKRKFLLGPGEDPTLNLSVPNAPPEKLRRRKAQKQEDVRAVLAKLAEWHEQGHVYVHRFKPKKGWRAGQVVEREYSTGWNLVRDWLIVLASTAWHVAEVERFAAAPDIEDLPKDDARGIAVISVKHKSGDLHRTTLAHAEQLAAVRRVVGTKPPPRLPARIKDAAKAVGAGDVRPGTMRHSALTWFVEAGATIKAAAEFGGHKSESTTRRFYLDVNVPAASKAAPLV